MKNGCLGVSGNERIPARVLQGVHRDGRRRRGHARMIAWYLHERPNGSFDTVADRPFTADAQFQFIRHSVDLRMTQLGKHGQ